MSNWTKNDTKGLVSVLSGCAAGAVTAQAIYNSYGKKSIVGIVGSALVGTLAASKVCDMVAYVTKWTLAKDNTEEVETEPEEAEGL